MQIGLWKTIASGIHAKTGTPRLWRPKGPIDPLTIYFSPTAAWLTLEQLQKIVDILTAEEAKKNVNTQLMSWLKFSAISQDDAQAKRVSKTAISLSEDLLKSYETLIDVGDSVERLAALQVEGLTSLEDFGWLRVEITENQATALQLKISAEENPKRISKPIVVQSLTHYTGKKSGAARKDAGKIMGGQSANDVSLCDCIHPQNRRAHEGCFLVVGQRYTVEGGQARPGRRSTFNAHLTFAYAS